MNHKIVCWGDYAIPVPEWANWMTFDNDGQCDVHEDAPYITEYGYWYGTITSDRYTINQTFNIETPEPGPWTEQLYWIGD